MQETAEAGVGHSFWFFELDGIIVEETILFIIW
jgi:hypothetical protein